MSDDTSNGGLSTPEETPSSVPPLHQGPDPSRTSADPMDPPSISFSSNYPRTGRTVFGQTRPPGIYWDSISTAFSMITSNVVTYGLCGLVAAAIGMATYSFLMVFVLRGISIGASAGYRIFLIAPQLVAQYVLMFPLFGLIAVGVSHAKGKTPEFSDFLIPFRKLNVTAYAALLAAAPAMAVTVVLRLAQAMVSGNPISLGISGLIFIPIAIAVHLCFTGQLLLSGTAAIFNGKSPVDTAKLTYARMGPHFVMFGFLFIVSQLISFIGVLLFCIGFVITLPVVSNVIALHYLYNFPEDHAPSPVSE